MMQHLWQPALIQYIFTACRHVKANQGAAYLAGQPPWVKGAGHHTLQQDIGALQITVQQPQGVKVLHPLRDVRQAQ